MMRALFFVVAALAALYGGYWFVGEARVERGLAQALADLEARGWEVSYASLNTTGFPSRFDTTITGLRLSDPGGRVVWEAPAIQAYALSYRPNQVIVDFPPEQAFAFPLRLRLAGEPAGPEVTLRSDRLRLSGHVGLSAARPLRAVTVEGDGLLLHDALTGQAAEAERVLLAIREAGAEDAGGTGASYDLFLEARGLTGPLLRGALDLGLDAAVTLDRPIDLAGQAPSALLAIDVRSASVAVSPGSLSVAGRLGVDADGALEGELDLSARGWAEVLAALRDAGVIEEGASILVERLLDEVARGTRGEAIEVPLLFEGGRITALGLPLGPSPVLAPPQRQ